MRRHRPCGSVGRCWIKPCTAAAAEMLPSPAALDRPRLRGAIHLWAVPIAAVLFAVLALRASGPADVAAVVVYGICVTGMLAVERDLPQRPVLPFGHGASEAPRPLDDPARDRGHLHRGHRPRPRRHHQNRSPRRHVGRRSDRHLDSDVLAPCSVSAGRGGVRGRRVVGPDRPPRVPRRTHVGRARARHPGRPALHGGRDRVRPAQAESLSRDIRLPRGLPRPRRAGGTCAVRGGVQPGRR